MNLANRLTVLRMVLAPVFAGTMFYWTPERDLGRVAAMTEDKGAGPIPATEVPQS